MNRPKVRDIAGVFGRYGNLTFGGGVATIGVLRHEIETKRGWIDSDQFQLCYGLCRLTPGTNLLAFCTAVGWLGRGWFGGLVALLAASVPCSAVVAVATMAFEIWTRNPWAKVALHGALAAAVGLVVFTCWSLIATNIRRSNWIRVTLLFGGAIALQEFAGMSPIQILLLCAGVAAILPLEKRR